MAASGGGYDLSVATFSPDGRVFQVEYATKAVDASCTAIALICKDGVVTAIEKPCVSKMTVDGSTPRIYAIDRHCTVGICGFPSDGRQVVKRAREEAAQYKHVFGEDIPPKVLAERLALFVHVHTVAWSIRPLGASIILSAIEPSDNGPSPAIYCIEPSGTCYKYYGFACGKARRSARTELDKLPLNDLTAKQAAEHAARILIQVREESTKGGVLDMFWICNESNYVAERLPPSFQKECEEKAEKDIAEMEATE